MPTWIRVRDTTTGHEYDVEERSLREGMQVLENYPPNAGPAAEPRPPKYYRSKDGKPATPPDPAAVEARLRRAAQEAVDALSQFDQLSRTESPTTPPSDDTAVSPAEQTKEV